MEHDALKETIIGEMLKGSKLQSGYESQDLESMDMCIALRGAGNICVMLRAHGFEAGVHLVGSEGIDRISNIAMIQPSLVIAEALLSMQRKLSWNNNKAHEYSRYPLSSTDSKIELPPFTNP